MSPCSVFLLFPVLCSFATPIAADVIVVDASGGGDFSTLVAAVPAAADGDLLLVLPGDYTGEFTTVVAIDDKELVIVGDGPGVLMPLLDVRNLSAGKSLVLRGLVFPPQIVFLLNTRIRDCQGAVFVEDCHFQGMDGIPTTCAMLSCFQAIAGLPHLWVSNSTAVSFHHCTFVGGDGNDTLDAAFQDERAASDGGAGLVVQGSNVTLYDCALQGGRGGHDLFFEVGGRNGAPGLDVSGSSRIVLSGCTIGGGAGGDGCNAAQACCGCLAAPGIRVSGDVVVEDLDDVLLGGSGGALDGGGSQPPAPPTAVASGSLDHVVHAGVATRLQKIAPLRTGEIGTLTLDGPPNALFALFLGFEPAYLPLLHFKGVFVPSLPLLLDGPLLVAVLDGAGHFEADYLAPAIAPFGLQHLLLVDQVLVDQGVDGITLGSGTTHVQVDTGF